MSELRVVVVGGGGVGKSALTVRFIQGNFVEKYDPTIEDSYRKQVEVEGQSYMLDVMDTAGQEEYSALRDSYMKTGQGFILAYDITSQQTFDQAQKLRVQIVRIKDDNEGIPIVLVGNKCDLEKDRVITTEVGSTFAKKHGLGFIEASAKTNTNVGEIFFELVKRINAAKLAEKKKPSSTSSGSKDSGAQAPKQKKGGICMLL